LSVIEMRRGRTVVDCPSRSTTVRTRSYSHQQALLSARSVSPFLVILPFAIMMVKFKKDRYVTAGTFRFLVEFNTLTV